MKDIANNKVERGDIVVYGVSHGHNIELKYGICTFEDDVKLHAITAHRRVYVPKTGQELQSEWELQKDGRPLSIYAAGRVLLVTDFCVPPELRKLLEGAYMNYQQVQLDQAELKAERLARKANGADTSAIPASSNA